MSKFLNILYKACLVFGLLIMIVGVLITIWSSAESLVDKTIISWLWLLVSAALIQITAVMLMLDI